MELAEKEIYLSAEDGDGSVSGFIEEIASAREKHPVSLPPDGTALLLLDMQRFFFDRNSHAYVPTAPRITGKITALRDRCIELDIPVIYTRHLNTQVNAGQMGRWWRDILTRGDLLSEIIDEFREPGITVVEKSQYSAFYGTGLEKLLRSRGISRLIIGGVMTHLCCETTARDAFIRDFDVVFGIDFTATYNRKLHASSLRTLAHGFAHPLTAEEILEKLK